MGTSIEQYIKMCDCPQIQDGWEPKAGDWCWHKDESCIITIHGISVEGIAWSKGEIKCYKDQTGGGYSAECITERKGFLKRVIWLLRLDQLLEMLPDLMWQLHKGNCGLPGYDFHMSRWYRKNSTPEQAVLQGVMHELHGLKWDGEKWE